MNVDDMDMDVAWCLTCSKRTRDSRHPYCSEACREQDKESPHLMERSVSITSSIPVQLIPSPAKITTRAVSPIKPARAPSRPPVTPLQLGPASVNGLLGASPIPHRDRRAFSFPATQSAAPAPISIANKREARQSQSILPPFARKSMGFSLNSVNIPSPLGKEGPDGLQPATARQTKSTGGANTPMDPESVFCSTSESEDEREIRPSPLRLLSKPTPATSILPSSSSMSRKSSKSKSQQAPPPVPSFQPHVLSGRKASQSPVAVLVASSSSSRSREDIISWAKAVGLRPGDSEDTLDEDEARGRSRTRRSEGLHMASSGHPASPEESEQAAGTTPKGRIGAAFANFNLPGMGIVKALTATVSPPEHIETLRTSPSQTEVSRMGVPTSSGGVTIPPANTSDNENPPQFGGATPTLSTISFSEAIDPSVGDQPEHIEVVTTDDAYSTSSFIRRPSDPKILKQPVGRQASAPLRPIITTATAIWNLSNYVRSFAPFSIASVVAPYAPFAAADKKLSVPKGTVTPIEEEPAQRGTPSVSPMPTSRVEQTGVSAQHMVRSLPMDIAIPPTDMAIKEERVREREAREWLDRSSSRHRSSSRRREQTRTASPGSSVASQRGRQHIRKPSYDGDASDEEDDEEPRRGRSRRVSKVCPKEEASSFRGRRLSDGVVQVLGERSASRSSGRGRRRAARA